jgi:SPP1 gp7 family putative phage head morphogenesis protein
MANNVFKTDPTQTLMIRNALSSAFYKKWRSIKGVIRDALIKKDVLGLRTNLVDGQFAYMPKDRQIREFNRFVTELIDNNIVDVQHSEKSDWQRVWWTPYLRQSYDSGVGRALTAAKQQGVSVPFWWDKATFIEGVPVHKEALYIIYEQAYSEILGVSDEVSKQLKRILADGLRRGESPYKVASEINKMIDKIGVRRAKTIARTEIVRAHNEGSLVMYEELGVQEVVAEVEWSTAEDDRVCPICASMGGTIFTVSEAHGILPIHPLCRCAWLPVV